MKVGIRVLWHVIVEDDVDSLNVHTSAKQIGSHQDAPLEVLELLVAGQARVGDKQRHRTLVPGASLAMVDITHSPLLLGHASVNSNGWEVLFH